MNESHWRRHERMYGSAPINAFYQAKLVVSEGAAELVIPVGPHLFHSAHAVHGSVCAKAVDDAAFFAANSLVEEVFVLTVHLDVRLFRPIASGEIRAHGRVVRAARTLLHAEAVLQDAEGQDIGRGSAIFARSKIPLAPEIGYA